MAWTLGPNCVYAQYAIVAAPSVAVEPAIVFVHLVEVASSAELVEDDARYMKWSAMMEDGFN